MISCCLVFIYHRFLYFYGFVCNDIIVIVWRPLIGWKISFRFALKAKVYAIMIVAQQIWNPMQRASYFAHWWYKRTLCAWASAGEGKRGTNEPGLSLEFWNLKIKDDDVISFPLWNTKNCTTCAIFGSTALVDHAGAWIWWTSFSCRSLEARCILRELTAQTGDLVKLCCSMKSMNECIVSWKVWMSALYRVGIL